MLKQILSAETCANCRNCCIFEKQSAWELPTFPKEAAAHLTGKNIQFTEENGRIRIALQYTDDRPQTCPFLDSSIGCTLPDAEKPFACKIWPVRIMRDESGIAYPALYRGCPGIPADDTEALKELLKNGLSARIFEETAKDPSLILPYHPNYIRLTGHTPQPEAVFRYFSALSAIPHGSGHTEQIRQWALNTAAKLSLDAYADAAGNVIIRKAASTGHENSPRVILQGHMDMVCAKLPDCPKNMETDGLTLISDGEYLSAAGTTLGGDDGIALAYAFALLEADDIPHPPLTVIFTVDEETGMDGAAALSPDALDGRYLINLDSEEEGIFTVGCAGGVRVHSHYPAETAEISGFLLDVTLSGLTGGHSGAEIHKPLLNANVTMLRLLRAIRVPVCLCAWQGGVRDNVIPTECAVTLCCGQHDADAVRQQMEQELNLIRAVYPQENVRLTVAAGEHAAGSMLTAEATAQMLRVLSALPNGVQKMNDKLQMPETSLNLGIFTLEHGEMQVDALIRSGINAEKEALTQQLIVHAAQNGGYSETSGDYPAWEYVPDTELEAKAVSVFTEMYGKPPVIQTIHAGLECGILTAKAAALQCISIGPELLDIHTPRERLSLASAERTWKFLLALLAAL